MFFSRTNNHQVSMSVTRKIFKSGLLQPNVFMQDRLHRPISSQQKIKHLGKLIPKLAKSSSNGKHQLLTRMLQAPRVLEG